MSAVRSSDSFLAGLTDFSVLVAIGAGAWWLTDGLVPESWCAGGRWDAVFLVALLPLFIARFLEPPQGRVRWMQSVLLAGCAMAVTPAAVLAGRLVAGCTDFEGHVGGLVVLPPLLAGLGTGLVAVAVWFPLAARLPAAEGEAADAYPRGVGRAAAAPAAISIGVILVGAWPILVDAAATALLKDYCPDQRSGNIMYFIILIFLGRAARHGGRAAWRTIALVSLAGLVVMMGADVLAGLAISCPPAGEELESGPRFLRLAIRAGGFTLAVAPLLWLSAKYERESKAEGDGKPGKAQ